jgi:hypothetical protein
MGQGHLSPLAARRIHGNEEKFSPILAYRICAVASPRELLRCGEHSYYLMSAIPSNQARERIGAMKAARDIFIMGKVDGAVEPPPDNESWNVL